MDLFSFFKRAQKQERAYNPAQWTPIGGSTELAERNLLTNNKEWVFIAANRIATSVAGIRYKVMRYQSNGDDQEVFQGPMVDFLENPSKNFTGADFIYLNTIYKELTGNAFWEKDGKTLIPLIPTLVSPIITNGVLTGYKYQDEAKERVIDVRDMLHDRYVDPARPYWGVGKLARIARWVDTSSYANEFLRRFFVNGATFGGFIETEEESEERIKLIKLGLVNDHVGVENAHKIAVLPKGSKFAAATATMSDMEMSSTDERYRDKILAGFGVPKTIVGLTTEVNRASAVASEYIYARYTIKPIVDGLIAFLNNNVAKTLDNSGKFYFAYDEFIPADKEAELKEREIALGKQPYMTVNEVRAEEGLPPVQGGDVVYGSPMQVPLGTPALAPAVPGTEPIPNEPKKAIPSRARAAMQKEKALDSIFERVGDVLTTHRLTDEEMHKGFIKRIDQHEKLIEEKVRLFNNRQQRDVVQRLNQITKGVVKGDFYDIDSEVAILIDFVSPILRGLMLEQAIEEYVANSFEGKFDPSKASVYHAVEMAAKRMARSYNDTTANLLKSALNEGIKAGEGTGQLTERINNIYAFSDSVRAAQVARTESVYIANKGSLEAYKQSGVVKTIRWYTAEDERVCEYCGPMNGKVVGVHERFFEKGDEYTGREGGVMKMDYRSIDVAPLHTNCRCLVRAEDIEVN